jgi:hypothetical protein
MYKNAVAFHKPSQMLNYLIPNLSDTKLIRYRICISDTELIRYENVRYGLIR